MRIGQTSLVVFSAKLVGSLLGFVSTLYFARLLGAEVLGVYALVVTVVGWLNIVGKLGIGGAAVKRISEGKEQGEFLSAVIIWLLLFGGVLSIAVVLAEPAIQSYIGEFEEYVDLSVVWFVLGFLFARFFFGTVRLVLKGERKVHLAGLLQPIGVGTKSIAQIVLVLAGFELLGMLLGNILGGVLVGAVGLYWVTVRPAWPAKRHFESLFGYAKFSWLGGIKSRAFNEVDILMLGFFVQTSLVGVYSVAWSIAKFLELFSSSIQATLFPEISHTSAHETKQAAADMVEDALTYTGLIAIPGLVGGAILDERLLRLYGSEFTQGTAVLWLLIAATLVYSFQSQLMNALNGLDRPDLAFRINAIFILLNTGLNLFLIWQFGLEGAAVATLLTAFVGLALSYYVLQLLIDFQVPVSEPTKQVVSALFMGVLVFTANGVIERADLLNNNAATLFLLVVAGAGVYFLTLLAISSSFRATVDRNVPFEFPHLF